MAAHTHAIFDEQGKFLGWVSYISGGYECDALDWHGETVADVEKFLDSVQAVPFDDLTDENWAAIHTRGVDAVKAFFTDEAGNCCFEPVEGELPFVGWQLSGKRKPQKTPCFFVEGDFGKSSYREVCRSAGKLAERKIEGRRKAHLFITGYEFIQSPSFMTHRIKLR